MQHISDVNQNSHDVYQQTLQDALERFERRINARSDAREESLYEVIGTGKAEQAQLSWRLTEMEDRNRLFKQGRYALAAAAAAAFLTWSIWSKTKKIQPGQTAVNNYYNNYHQPTTQHIIYHEAAQKSTLQVMPDDEAFNEMLAQAEKWDPQGRDRFL
jgi:hypothetical protein